MSAWTDNTPVGNPLPRGFYGSAMMVMAGSLLVFLRKDIGVRLLPRFPFLVAAALLLGLCFVEDPFDRDLAWFAGLFLGLMLFHRFRHMRRIKRGFPEWHSYDTGRSLLLGFLPLPRTFVQLVIEPAGCCALGWWLSQRSNSTFYLGWWITLASVPLFNLENTIRVARRDSLFDLGDTVIESINYARRAEKFAEGAGRAGAADGRASVKSAEPWFHAAWKALRAAQQAKRTKHDAGERRRRGQEEAEARARRQREQQEQEAEDAAANPWRDPTAGRMTVEQALEILELKAGVTAGEIRAAYSRLMQKVHPDAGGSTFFAKQLNLARDTLLRPQRKSG